MWEHHFENQALWEAAGLLPLLSKLILKNHLVINRVDHRATLIQFVLIS